MPTSKYNTAWSHDELTLALYLYCQIPFSKTKANNPDVISLSQLIGRTPASVARKLGNFGAFDPLLAKAGVSGLTHTGKSDSEIWHKFYQNWDLLVSESDRLLKYYSAQEISFAEQDIPIVCSPTDDTDRPATVMARRGQDFFRRSILSSYDNQCCICGLNVPELLVGSHIIPWRHDKQNRLNPKNGLCLCALHDKAFDRFLITVASNFEIKISQRFYHSKCTAAASFFHDFDANFITLPRRFSPDSDSLEWHFNCFMEHERTWQHASA